jgi:hypothetical protein
MKPSAIRIERMLEKLEATLVPPPRPSLCIVIHQGEDDGAVKEKKEKALAEHVACHPEDAGRTDFNWIVWEIVHRLSADELSEAEISAAEARDEKTKGKIEDEFQSSPLNGRKGTDGLPRRSSPLICRRLTLVASLARSHGDPCINVLLGISADRRGRNGNDDPARASITANFCKPVRGRRRSSGDRSPPSLSPGSSRLRSRRGEAHSPAGERHGGRASRGRGRHGNEGPGGATAGMIEK